MINQSQTTNNSCIFADTEGDIGKRFGRSIADQTRGCFGGVTKQAGSDGEKRNDDGEGRIRMAEHLNGQERAADWADNRVNGIPNGIDPWNFVGEEFQTIKDSGNNDNCGVTEDIERLIGGSKRDPVKMNRQAGDKNG